MNSVKTLQPQDQEFESFQATDEHSENHLVEDEQLEPKTVDDSTDTKPVSSFRKFCTRLFKHFHKFKKI